ncbi:MAG: hypothetical protein PHH23_09170 [Paludibacteraceae bacterium]|nr:hypothetical protein [Paludibacteraceae bacterium]
MENITRTNEEFRVTTSDFSEMVGSTHFNTDLKFIRCHSGNPVIAIDSIEHSFTEQHSFILSEYMTFQVKEVSVDFSVTCITISLPFYYEIVSGFDGTIFNVLLHSAPELYECSDLQAANLIFENMCLLYKNTSHSHRRSMAMNLIACYIYEIYELTLPRINVGTEKCKRTQFTSTIFSLYGLVAEHCYNNKNIKFYAEKLNMSSRYLYKIVHNTCHITPNNSLMM